MKSASFQSNRNSKISTVVRKDAANRLGQPLPALLLVEGWHIKRLLAFLGIGVFSSICATALATILGKSVTVGATVGSYTFGIMAVLVGILTFFSAIL
jgi:hypothetical protein